MHGERRDAEQALVALGAQANVAPAVGARMTMGDLLDRWLARGAGGWSPATVRNVRSIVETHLRPNLGHVLLGDLTAAMVDELYAACASTGGRTRSR